MYKVEQIGRAHLRYAPAVLNPTCGLPATFIDPRRAMLGVRLNLGR